MTSSQSTDTAELSRPHRQYQEDRRAKTKPQGRKRKVQQRSAKLVNWHSPFLWSQIETAATRAGKPWRPREILKEAQKMDSMAFARLTEQVIGRWIDSEAKGRGVSQWTASTLTRVATGNSPGGQSTCQGILVRPFHQER